MVIPAQRRGPTYSSSMFSCHEEGNNVEFTSHINVSKALAYSTYRNMVDKVLGDGNLSRVSAICVKTGAFIVTLTFRVRGRIRLHLLTAIVLFATLAGSTLSAGIDKASDADAISNLEVGDITADALDSAGNLMSRCHWKQVQTPITVRGMHIGMANAAVMNLNVDVSRSRVGASKLRLLEFALGVERREGERSFSVLDGGHG